jgi:hypothetical protein
MLLRSDERKYARHALIDAKSGRDLGMGNKH